MVSVIRISKVIRVDEVCFLSFNVYINICFLDKVILIFFNERFNPETDFEGELKDTNVTECFRYPPKKGHGILFDGHQYHSGNSPIDNLHRTIINFDFIV